jgi:hypothetical protein
MCSLHIIFHGTFAWHVYRMNDDRRFICIDTKGTAGKSSPINDQCTFEYVRVGYRGQFG